MQDRAQYKTGSDSAGKGSAVMTCPRCGEQAPYFDQLAIQPCYVPREKLLPVHKCPACKHLFALVPEPEA
jgi:hypothetical protein